jgi:hypothetical protein
MDAAISRRVSAAAPTLLAFFAYPPEQGLTSAQLWPSELEYTFSGRRANNPILAASDTEDQKASGTTDKLNF